MNVSLLDTGVSKGQPRGTGPSRIVEDCRGPPRACMAVGGNSGQDEVHYIVDCTSGTKGRN